MPKQIHLVCMCGKSYSDMKEWMIHRELMKPSTILLTLNKEEEYYKQKEKHSSYKWEV